MTTVLKTVIVGCGVIGEHHARVIASHPAVTVVAVVDAVPASAEALATTLAEELNQPRPLQAATLREAVEGSEADLVVICTPSGAHVSAAEEAIALGCHVVIEKPLDVSMTRARTIAEPAATAAEAGIVVSVMSQHRFDPASVAIAAAIADGSLGTITSAVASMPWWRSQEYYDKADWRGTWQWDGGGALMNQGIHTLDLLVWFLGTPVEVTAFSALLAHERIEVEDTLAAAIRFESGALAVLHATTSAAPGLAVRLALHGTEGSAVLDNEQLDYLATQGGVADLAALGLDPADVGGGIHHKDSFVRGHYRQYDDIVDAIATGRPPAVGVGEALATLAVVRAAYLSASLGTTIRVRDVLDGSYDDIPYDPTVADSSARQGAGYSA